MADNENKTYEDEPPQLIQESKEESEVLGEPLKRHLSYESDEDSVKKMRPNYFTECFPITGLDKITEVLESPPNWANKILPRHARSGTVVQNVISDCHVESHKFVPKTRWDGRFIPKTLVCHDYKGGYLEDKHLSSTTSGNLYSFYNWAHIDIFVYFSHNFITIPPICWTNAAHKSGVKILGTLITEFNPGSEICRKVFKDEDTMRLFAYQLTQIARIFKFDGYLLNIENPLPDTDLLKKFVNYLTQLIHEDNSESIVIWYDSVIETGELKWQNELNEKNKPFFDVCDGIFLNYVWTEENIQNSVAAAKHRALDVFVGIDVFGRNTYGGGQFNSYKAAQVIRRYNLSMAIFAPGWTHEALPTSGERQEFFEDFFNRDSAFWNSLWPYLYTHPIKEFFRTNFFTGVNQAVYNLFEQHVQLSRIKHPKNMKLVPYHSSIPTLNNKCDCLQCAYTDRGVRCLITKQYLSNQFSYIHRLFTCDLDLSGTIVVYFLTKNLDHNYAMLSLSLLTVTSNGSIRKIRCNATDKTQPIDTGSLLEVNQSKETALIDYVSKHYETLIFQEGLSICAYQFNVLACTLLEVGAIIEEGHSIYLCGFGIERDAVY